MRKYISDSLVNSDYYCDRDRELDTAAGRYLTQIEEGFIRECLAVRLTKSALIFDIGGGSGRIAIPLHKDGYRVIVEEINPLPLRILRDRESQIPLILVSCRAKHFPIKESSIDCVLCIRVDLLIESEWFFSECNRILKQSGIIIFTTLNRYSYKGLYRKFIRREDCNKYPWKKFEYASSFQQMKLHLKNAGFKLIGAKGFNWVPASHASNNASIPFFALIEKLLRLDRLLSLSPWIIIEARKIKEYAS